MDLSYSDSSLPHINEVDIVLRSSPSAQLGPDFSQSPFIRDHNPDSDLNILPGSPSASYPTNLNYFLDSNHSEQNFEHDIFDKDYDYRSFSSTSANGDQPADRRLHASSVSLDYANASYDPLHFDVALPLSPPLVDAQSPPEANATEGSDGGSTLNFLHPTPFGSGASVANPIFHGGVKKDGLSSSQQSELNPRFTFGGRRGDSSNNFLSENLNAIRRVTAGGIRPRPLHRRSLAIGGIKDLRASLQIDYPESGSSDQFLFPLTDQLRTYLSPHQLQVYSDIIGPPESSLSYIEARRSTSPSGRTGERVVETRAGRMPIPMHQVNTHSSTRTILNAEHNLYPLMFGGGVGGDVTASYKHYNLLLDIVGSPRKMALAASLQGPDAQHMVNFLTRVLEPRDSFLKENPERKRTLHLLSKIVKSAQIFPRSIELSGVQCSLANPINDSGAFGSIYQGLFKGQLVCVKAVRVSQTGPSKKVLRAHSGELVIGAYVSHPNILPFYGAYISYEAKVARICIVSPWMGGGSLDEYLQEFPTMPRIPLLLDVITGLGHLHELDIIHSDLKASNILVSDVGRARLADFGLSTIALTNIGATTAKDFSGTTKWMAPERFSENDVPTRATDIWAFGCVCLEVMTGNVPFSHFKPHQLMSAFIKGEQPSPRGSFDIPDRTVLALSNSCWDYDPDKRPTAREVRETLTNLKIKDTRPNPVDATSAALIAEQRVRSYTNDDYDAVLPILQNIVHEGDQ